MIRILGVRQCSTFVAAFVFTLSPSSGSGSNSQTLPHTHLCLRPTPQHCGVRDNASYTCAPVWPVWPCCTNIPCFWRSTSAHQCLDSASLNFFWKKHTPCAQYSQDLLWSVCTLIGPVKFLGWSRLKFLPFWHRLIHIRSAGSSSKGLGPCEWWNAQKDFVILPATKFVWWRCLLFRKIHMICWKRPNCVIQNFLNDKIDLMEQAALRRHGSQEIHHSCFTPNHGLHATAIENQLPSGFGDSRWAFQELIFLYWCI